VLVRAYLRQSDQALRNLRNRVDARQQKINTIMKKAVNKQQFIDMQKLICDSSANCRVFSSDLKLISFDGGHLTQDGAKYLGNILFRDSQLNQLK
jgi:lysophospholipase L1-like esterase